MSFTIHKATHNSRFKQQLKYIRPVVRIYQFKKFAENRMLLHFEHLSPYMSARHCLVIRSLDMPDNFISVINLVKSGLEFHVRKIFNIKACKITLSSLTKTGRYYDKRSVLRRQSVQKQIEI